MKTVLDFVGEGRTRVEANVNLTGRGINVLLTGGESPHIGGVVMCIPRKSDISEKLSADTWVIPVPGHKDHVVAQPFGEILCIATGQTTVVTAGIHIDNATGGELEQIACNCRLLAQEVIYKLNEN